ncbi:hypothetical protein BJ165DRAFT_1530819 [Panaeolus papilionaceus]|nr:hypothetical protein BJ165DRAFT_1530819 [Panaeolus papilionaceus]
MTRRAPSKTSTNSRPSAMYLTLVSLFLCRAIPHPFPLGQVYHLTFQMAQKINYTPNVRLSEAIEQATLCCVHNGYLEASAVYYGQDGEPVEFYHVTQRLRDKFSSADTRPLWNQIRGSAAEVIVMSTIAHQCFSMEQVGIMEEYYRHSKEGENTSCFNLRMEELWQDLEEEEPKRRQ